MGYSHYSADATATPAVIADTCSIIETSGIAICGPLGTGAPKLDLEDGIWLNGSEALDEDYETFHLPGTDGVDGSGLDGFCKTGRRPYDTVVTAIYISAAVRNGQRFGTDGTWEDWAAGITLFERAVRPLTEDEKIMLEMIVSGLRHVPEDSPATAGKAAR
ncbi:hypothetical protein [Pseudarthrobacter sp. BIM B-2242]|uniref:hypothetical protein n=1 Tax=Pseudarthrobacter sp. BIM B-2242 TaxID=2772401 RepID=UPI00168B3921|nr:hypothetical protein [Pseudarthrobacter sp. BIM B-2242]QOD06092.1 hypothetical protein IDT60_21255 [Pseudarthrobacter sp. BIM B-2242]